MTEQEAYIAFNLTDQIGSARLEKLIAEAGDVVSAWARFPESRRVSRSGRPIDPADEMAQARRYGVRILTPVDAEYPRILKESPGHPLCLYVKGSVAALNTRAVSIVGTRKATPYGTDQAFGIARGLAAAGLAVVSGLALGIDAESHRGALAAGGLTVGILGSALDRFYPAGNRELAREIVRTGGAVVSQFPFGRECDQQTFPIRNHVVAALGEATVVIEAPHKSGTLITAGLAADLGRTVFVIPSRVDSRAAQGNLALLRDGARLVRGPEDILEDMGVEGRKEQGGRSKEQGARSGEEVPPFSVEESLVMRAVTAEGVEMDRLAALTGLSATKVNTLCMGLRLKGRIRFFPGNRVALPRTS